MLLKHHLQKNLTPLSGWSKIPNANLERQLRIFKIHIGHKKN